MIVICTWYLTLAGLRERERIRPREDGWSAFYGSFEKKTFSKKLSKTFGGYDKISYLCIRFLKRTAIVKQAIFEQIYINNTSSTRKNRTVNACWIHSSMYLMTGINEVNKLYGILNRAITGTCRLKNTFTMKSLILAQDER